MYVAVVFSCEDGHTVGGDLLQFLQGVNLQPLTGCQLPTQTGWHRMIILIER